MAWVLLERQDDVDVVPRWVVLFQRKDRWISGAISARFESAEDSYVGSHGNIGRRLCLHSAGGVGRAWSC